MLCVNAADDSIMIKGVCCVNAVEDSIMKVINHIFYKNKKQSKTFLCFEPYQVKSRGVVAWHPKLEAAREAARG